MVLEDKVGDVEICHLLQVPISPFLLMHQEMNKLWAASNNNNTNDICAYCAASNSEFSTAGVTIRVHFHIVLRKQLIVIHMKALLEDSWKP